MAHGKRILNESEMAAAAKQPPRRIFFGTPFWDLLPGTGEKREASIQKLLFVCKTGFRTLGSTAQSSERSPLAPMGTRKIPLWRFGVVSHLPLYMKQTFNSPNHQVGVADSRREQSEQKKQKKKKKKTLGKTGATGPVDTSLVDLVGYHQKLRVPAHQVCDTFQLLPPEDLSEVSSLWKN